MGDFSLPIPVSFVADSYIDVGNRLYLSFHGNLDQSLSQDIGDICDRLPSRLGSCTIDLVDIEEVFDSGVVQLLKLSQRLGDTGATIEILSDRPDIRRWVTLVLH